MNLRYAVLAALLTTSGVCSADDLLYTYTGAWFEPNLFYSQPSQVVGHFVFDFENSPQAADGIYTVKRWDISAHGIGFASKHSMHQYADFNFKFVDGNIVDWNVSVGIHEVPYTRIWTSRHGGDGVSPDAWHMPSATTWNTGAWTVTPVPEPATWLMLGAGAVLLAGARRFQPRA